MYLKTKSVLQAEYSQSPLSRHQLQQSLSAFQAKSHGHADWADAQRRSLLEAQAVHFLQPDSVKVSPLWLHVPCHFKGHSCLLSA